MAPTAVDIVYLDHNVVVGIAGLPRWADAAAERARVLELHDSGVQFALSGWHAYELARSEDHENVRQYCELVEQIEPLWANNPTAIKRQELHRFLASMGVAQTSESVAIYPFSRSVAEMWGSYGGPVIIGETFRNTVRELQVAPNALKIAEQAADTTPKAITTARGARADGRLGQAQNAIDREYFAGLLKCGISDARLDLILERLSDLYRACPMIAVENVLTQVRARDSFTPTASHAPDLQHALVALVYSSAFITDDKSLLENCRITLNKSTRPTQLHRRVCKIVVPGVDR